MTGPVWEFYRLVGAVLAANLLTALFIWAAVSYTKLEKEGREKQLGGRHIASMVLVFAFLFAGLLASGFFNQILDRFN